MRTLLRPLVLAVLLLAGVVAAATPASAAPPATAAPSTGQLPFHGLRSYVPGESPAAFGLQSHRAGVRTSRPAGGLVHSAPITTGYMETANLNNAITYQQGVPVIGSQSSPTEIQIEFLGHQLDIGDESSPIQAGGIYGTDQDAPAFLQGVCGDGVDQIDEAEVDQVAYNGNQVVSIAVHFVCLDLDGSTLDASGIPILAWDLALAVNVGATTPHQGYYTFEANGAISGFGGDNFLNYLGDLSAVPLNSPIVGMAQTADGGGYWLVGADGGIFAFGDAGYYGSMGGSPLNKPIVGMAATPDGKGYWLVASDGGIFAFGDAAFYGSMGGSPLNKPIVGMAPAPTGGYWLVASDGGIFAFGNAGFYGSTGNITLNQPVVGMAPTPDGRGYWFVAADGGIFSYGDAGFAGSTGSFPLNEPIVGMATNPTGTGYWLIAADGGIFSFGVPFYGSLPSDGDGVTDVVGLSV